MATGQSPARALWALQLAGWLLLACLFFTIDQGRSPDPPYGEIAVRALGWAGLGLGVSTVVWRFYAAAAQRSFTPLRLALVASAGTLAGAIAWSALSLLLEGLVFRGHVAAMFRELDTFEIFDEWVTYAATMLAWSGMAFAQMYLARASAERERALEAEALRQQAHLVMLRYQVNPHFLFNSLNSAIAAIDEDAAGAQDMLVDLSKVLRHALRAPEHTDTTLGAELEMVRSYIDVERRRFEDRLQMDVEVEPGTESVPLPPLLLQPLIENAVKHGMQTSPMPLRIRVRTRRQGDDVIVEIANTGSQDREPGAGDGLGLRNVRARVEARFGAGRFELVERDGWVHATVRLAGTTAGSEGDAAR